MKKAFGYGINPETLAKTWKHIPYYLIFDDREPVGTIILYQTGQVAGVHSLGILPQRRKQGYATEIMKHILNMALDKGATLATLQASEMAKNLYTKMGFSLDFIMTNHCLPTIEK
ncbi:GNAT family N-acetyltransferase [Flagellimonas flava]|uniref:GNAT family N-acetyltransferase n=1 Tax=Flagellimonas flava TaxID=570519 RepID=UPI000933CA2A|nr:GNAT family N-acetyltransferase [Allomuricauda flava]